MNTADEIKSIRQMYAAQHLQEREEALRPVEAKWNALHKQLQWDCEQETGHRMNDAGVCILCGKTETHNL